MGRHPALCTCERCLTRNGDPDRPQRASYWRDAAQQGTAPALLDLVLAYGAHWGYRPDERPMYAPCQGCGETLRVDRLDLVHEHLISACSFPMLRQVDDG
jgi:hypothetical protein